MLGKKNNGGTGEVAEAAEKPAKKTRAPKEPKEKKVKKKKAAAPSSKPSARGKRFVFIIGDEGAILVFLQGAKVVRRLFAPSAQPGHTEVMLEILRANPTAPVYVLADVLDQQYVPQTFPPVSSMSVGGLVKRRLSRDFQPDDLKNSLPLGRDKSGRKEWKFLLVALAKTPLMSEWIDLLINLTNEFKGIYLVPVESIVYLNTLSKKLGNETPRPWQMLISHNKISGFRQVVVNDGRLVFTRVSQAIDDAIPAVIAGNIEQEIINTLEYLKRLDFKDEGLLDVYVVISQDVGESLDLKRFGFADYKVLTPLAVSEALNLEQAALTADRFGDVVMAAAFGVAKKRMLRFSTTYMDRLAKLYQARAALKVVAAMVVLACLGLSLMSVVGIIQAYEAASTAEESDHKLQADLQAMQKKVSGLNVDVAYKSAIVTASDSYLKNTPLPEDLIALVAPFTSLQTRFTSVTWQYDAGSKGAPPPAGGPVEMKINVDMSNAGNDPEQLTHAADALVQSIKGAVKDYEVTTDTPYKWASDKGEQLSLDMAAVNIPADKKVMMITLRGPKKGKTP